MSSTLDQYPDRVFVLDHLTYHLGEDGSILNRRCWYFDIPMTDVSRSLQDFHHKTHVSGPPHTFSPTFLYQIRSEGIPSASNEDRDVQLMCRDMYACTAKLIGATNTEGKGDHAVALMSLADAHQVYKAPKLNDRIGNRTRKERSLYDTLIRSTHMPLGLRSVEWCVIDQTEDDENNHTPPVKYEVRSWWKDVTEDDWNAFLGRNSQGEDTPGSFAVPPHLVVPDLVADDGTSVIEDSQPPTPGFIRAGQHQQGIIWHRM